MRKIAIFVEGQAEQIFIRDLLLRVFNCSKLSFSCVKLYADQIKDVPYNYNVGKSYVEIHFLLVDAANDKKVLSAIKDREEYLFEKGYEIVFGLRDMYSDEYCKYSTTIDDDVTNRFIEGANQSISLMSWPEKIQLHFAIMELEAWFLGMYNLFYKISSTLKVDYIEDRIGYNLSEIDPQRQFYKPSDELDLILRLVDLQYQKHSHDVNSISSRIDRTDCDNAIENGRCQSFNFFYQELLSFSEAEESN